MSVIIGTYELDTDIVFLTYFNDCDHLWLAIHMFSALISYYDNHIIIIMTHVIQIPLSAF